MTTLEVDRVMLSALGHPVASAQPTEATSSAPSDASDRTPASKSRAPSTPTMPPVGHRLQFAIAERMAACGDPTPPELHRLVILSEGPCFEGSPGELLANILKAGGYELTSEPADYEKISDLYDPAPRAVLLMGDPALKALRPRATVMLAGGKFKAIDGVDTLCTFDPVYIETNSATKKAVWTHLKTLLKRIDLDVPDWVKKKK